MATSRLSRVSVARQTSPIPPSPTRWRISYGPRRAPAARGMKCGDYMALHVAILWLSHCGRSIRHWYKRAQDWTLRLMATRDWLADWEPKSEAMLADSVVLALLIMLDALEPAERLVFVLHEVFGLTFDEIAPIVDRSPAAARQLAGRARRRVQTILTDPERLRRLDLSAIERHRLEDSE